MPASHPEDRAPSEVHEADKPLDGVSVAAAVGLYFTPRSEGERAPAAPGRARTYRERLRNGPRGGRSWPR